jgi:two-component system, NarL family, response regulator DegU
MKILIVDDNNNFRLALKTALEYQDFVSKIAECRDGDEVLDFLYIDQQIDCILMDISMKRMDGLTAAALVKKQFPNLPIVMLSMHDEENYYSTARLIGVSAFLLKNIELNTLFKCLHDVTGGAYLK